MKMVLHIIVLLFEVLYYSMFMKFARKEGKFWRYLLLFSLITIVGLFILIKQDLFSYLILILMMLFGLKYIVKLKTSLYDMLLIVIMLMLKLVIEFIVYIIFFQILNFGHFETTMIFDIIKILTITLFSSKIYNYNKKLKKLWDSNNFYIRYIFSCLTYVYVIFTLLLKILLPFIK